ncbi:hypothetical protein FRC10_004275 [Ceratobasidium sp. 414]|nr:hypothetical protein FRC10_004275 [Ceratobasidium sp. 414]
MDAPCQPALPQQPVVPRNTKPMVMRGQFRYNPVLVGSVKWVGEMDPLEQGRGDLLRQYICTANHWVLVKAGTTTTVMPLTDQNLKDRVDLVVGLFIVWWLETPDPVYTPLWQWYIMYERAQTGEDIPQFMTDLLGGLIP